MKFESPIDEKFFYSPRFCELINDAKKKQIDNLKGKIDDLHSPENPVMKEIFGDETYEKIRINNIERMQKNSKKA